MKCCKNCRWSNYNLVPQDGAEPAHVYYCMALPGQLVPMNGSVMTMFPARAARGLCSLWKLSWRKLFSRSHG